MLAVKTGAITPKAFSLRISLDVRKSPLDYGQARRAAARDDRRLGAIRKLGFPPPTANTQI
jgi:hypothetical protein